MVTTAAAARKLVGKEVSWNDRRDVLSLVNPPVRSGTLLEVQGKNARMDIQGSIDWKWLPDMLNVREVGTQATADQALRRS